MPTEGRSLQARDMGGAADWDVLFDGYRSCVDLRSAEGW
jgi:hypothetical protein